MACGSFPADRGEVLRNLTFWFAHLRDTVASVGYLWSRTLPFVHSDQMMVFRQALSLDEVRVMFKHMLMERAIA